MIFLIFTIVTGLEYANILKRDMNYIAKQLTNGSLPDGRLSIEDVELLFENLQNNTKIVHSEQIGTSYLDHPIMAYSICSNNSNTTPSMLITSLHHSREVASLQMNLYLFLYILWEVEYNNNPYYTHMIEHNCITTVPFVNYDGYVEISQGLKKHINLPETRKNLNRTKHCHQTILGGVDLNRNYGYKFGIDDSGSSNDPCDETYRGAEAFSEKETQAIKHIVETRNIKMAMNLHCFGNLWIIPYSYGDEGLDPNSVPAQIYEDFKQNGEFKGHYKYGHAQQLVNYNANGEAADWMLSKGVIAISPELGEEYYGNFFQNFYPDKNQTIKLFEMEFPSLLHFINYLPFNPQFIQSYQYRKEDFSFSNLIYNSSQVLMEIVYKNYGVSKGMNEQFHIKGHQIQQIYYKIINFNDEITKEYNFSILDQLPYENDLNSYHIPPRCQIVYYILFEIIPTQSSDIQLYFEMYEKDNNITTIQFQNFDEEDKNKTSIQHLLYLFYITIFILIVLIILWKKDFKKISNSSHTITELIEQKPETVVLKIQM